jgi:hypothetical protein
LDAPNKEYGDALNACAIRARYNVRDNVVAENVGLGIAGTDLCGASAIYLTNQNDGVSRYEKNHFTTILRGEAKGVRYAQALALEGHSITYPDVDVIQGNTFRSNHLMVRTSGYDGVCGGQAIKDCEFSWVDGPTAAGDFLKAAKDKLKAIGLDSNAAAKEVFDARAKQVTELTLDAPIRPERAFWFTKYYSGDEKCVIENSRFGNTDPGTYTHGNLAHGGSVHLEATGLVKITRPAAGGSDYTVTRLVDPRDERIKALEAELDRVKELASKILTGGQ